MIRRFIVFCLCNYTLCLFTAIEMKSSDRNIARSPLDFNRQIFASLDEYHVPKFESLFRNFPYIKIIPETEREYSGYKMHLCAVVLIIAFIC